jgi:hypothetical protein
LALCLNKNIQNNIQRQFLSFLNSNSPQTKTRLESTNKNLYKNLQLTKLTTN